ncbi:MAG: hypothetical protein GWN00_08880, partial [Aliifodinibius sp.]|nr:hypothetical protein [Fodinibius sp.]NIV11293.1 hypothetical protein [Fodinibius sp.]NIY24914.1 hypothetical protein [Fodinibius sp.]
ESSGGEASTILLDDITVTGLYNPENYWVKAGGPSGGMGYDVRFGSADRQDMFVTDNYAGVYKSNDGGNTWY